MVDDVIHGFGWPLLVEAGVSELELRPFALPIGTVTFLMTDVEGSSRGWEGAPEAMAAAIARHYSLLDGVVARRGGVRPVEQGEGDSIVAAFSRPSDAVAAALDAQLAFEAEPWPVGAALRVRMAVHTGEAQVRDGGYYVGEALNRCARLRSVAYGGQILLSSATCSLVTDRLPPGAGVIDLGEHRLKDLARPERVGQLAHPGLARRFPALRSLEVFRHNLPVQLTPLVGRRREIGEIGGLLEAERLVTLTGPGGVGKTRLALAVAADLVDQRPGGVWWVELASLSEPDAVGQSVLAAIGGRPVFSVPMAEQIAVALERDPALVVLDNCEHLVEACAELVAELLVIRPDLAIVATSREPLGVPGEIVWRVPSLRCPGRHQVIDVPTLSQFDAAVLFIERARRARPSFRVDDANAPAIAQICHRLDGIPLAIELAAARCRQMSAERIASEVDDRFRLLTGGARTVMPRQQTLAASIDWSHDRLSMSEQAAFRRLGVFSGSFPLEAAEVVVSTGGDIEPVEVFDLVSGLVDKSLVVVYEAPHGDARYRLLESLRVYARDRAGTAGELERLRDRCSAWWSAWLEPRVASGDDHVLDELDEFSGSLRAALDWAARDPVVGLELLGRLAALWHGPDQALDIVAAADRLLTDDNAALHPGAWVSAATATAFHHLFARTYGEFERHLRRVETVAVLHGDDDAIAFARSLLHHDVQHGLAFDDRAQHTADPYGQALAAVITVEALTDTDPAAATTYLTQHENQVASTGSELLRGWFTRSRARIAQDTGDLNTCIDLARSLTTSRSALVAYNGIILLAQAGLLAGDVAALDFAVAAAATDTTTTSRITAEGIVADTHRRYLTEHHPSEVDPIFGVEPVSTGSTWLCAKEAIDAGHPDLALTVVRSMQWSGPFPDAVRAAVDATVGGTEDRWHDALAVAVENDLRLIAVDALEALAAQAAASESWVEALRLTGAAQRLRDETGYRWRFPFEDTALTRAHSAAVAGADEQAAAALAAGRNTEWKAAAAYAQRARGERKRPRHGWDSLTPTETDVVALVAEGLTNPQIATRLLMGRATVKTHLEHIFTKLAIRSRSELAAAATRRSQPT